MKGLFVILIVLCSVIVGCTPPPNDICTDATAILPNGSCTSGTTVGMVDNWTGSVGCQGGGQHPDVWYSFTATGSQAQFTITTAAPWLGDVELVLAQGTCAGGFAIVGSQCGPSSLNAVFNGIQIGTVYYFTISNTNTGTPGPFQVCVTNTTPPPLAGQDCSNAAILCNSNSFSQPTSNAGFSMQEVNQANSCWLVGGERQSKWFKFTIGCTGTLEFSILPVNNKCQDNGPNAGDDYDFALWDVTTLGCPTVSNSSQQAIACNWSLNKATTGLSSCPTSEPNPNGCNSTAQWGAPVVVTAGHTYALLIDNFTTSNSGFTLTFGGACGGGTAKIGPDATFGYNVGTCGTYKFTKTCPTTNSTFLWQFGDGTTSTSQDPSHTYSTFGNMVVTLQVTDALGFVANFAQALNVVATAPPTVSTPVVYCVGQVASPLTAT